MQHPAFKTDVEKAIEAAGVLLRKESARRMSRLRLVKLLYIANRRALKELGRPLLASKVVAMQHGPVHSEVYSLINEDHPQTDRWASFIGCEGPRDVKLLKQTRTGKLSKLEVEILRRTVDDHATFNDWEIAELTHTFGEWDKNYPDRSENTSRPIPMDDIVRNAVQNDQVADYILDDLHEQADFDRLFAQ